MVAVLSESFARAMFGDEDAVGQMFDPDEPTIVVGIVGDLRYGGKEHDPVPAIYYARSQRPSELFCLVIRRAGDADVATAVRQAVRQADPTLPAMNMATLDQLADESIADRRFYTTTTSVFAALALVLTATGLMVVIARSVVERRREMAIRLALGARPGALVGLVARQGLWPVLAGTAAGLGVAWFASRLVEQFLFGVAVREPAVFAAAALLTVVVAIVAAVAPARALTRLGPASVLRSD
jgi:predicted lysophospholipase L1 biosynthesis ABC-type transport system permease subunit